MLPTQVVNDIIAAVKTQQQRVCGSVGGFSFSFTVSIWQVGVWNQVL